MTDLLLALLAVFAAAVAGWRTCVALRVEPLLDELDQAVTDNSALMRQKAGLLTDNAGARRTDVR